MSGRSEGQWSRHRAGLCEVESDTGLQSRDKEDLGPVHRIRRSLLVALLRYTWKNGLQMGPKIQSHRGLVAPDWVHQFC